MNTKLHIISKEKEKTSHAHLHGRNSKTEAAIGRGMLSRFSHSLLLLCVMAFSFTAHAQTKTVLFNSPFTSDYNKSMPYRIPAIVETVDNSTGMTKILVFSDKRHGGGDVGQYQSNNKATNAHVDLVYKSSLDNGATWSSEQTIVRGSSTMGYGDVAVVADRENPKNIVFFCAAGNVFFTNSTSANPLRCYRFRSSDGGENWDATEVTDDVYSLFDYTAAFFSSGRICQSSKIKVGSHYRLYTAQCVNGTHSIVLYSDNFGETWNVLGGKGTVAVRSGNEAKCEELPNGSVLVSSRVSNGRYFNVFNYNDETYTSGSWDGRGTGLSGKDGGATNGEVLLVPAKNSSNESCYIMLQSLPFESGRKSVGICWRKLSTSNYARTSEFTGSDWNTYSITNLYSGYSTMILQSDGHIGFAYEDNYDSSLGTGGYDITYMNLPLETITGGQYTYDNGESDTPEVQTVESPVISPDAGEVEAGNTISISCETEGASIYYTLNGAEPTVANGTRYIAPFALENSCTVKAIAVKEGWNNSAVSSATYTVKVADEDDEEEPVLIKYRFKNVQMDGTIYYFQYTGEGSDNGLKMTTQESEATLYTRTTIDEENGVYTFQSEDGNYLIWSGRNLSTAGDRGYNDGLGYYKTYNADICNLTIASMQSGGQVKTTNGEYMTIMGKRYKSSAGSIKDAYYVIKVDGNIDGADEPYYNENFSSAFIIEEVDMREVVETPVINPNGGEVEAASQVTISCATEGATIYYTIDGTEPTAQGGTIYTEAIVLEEACTVKAVAVKEGCRNSAVATASFTIKPEVETIEWATKVFNCNNCRHTSYATLYLDYAVELPYGVRAYRAEVNTKTGVLSLKRINSGIVPAYCAVVIMNAYATSSITLTKTTTNATYRNDLKGTLETITLPNKEDYYVFGHTSKSHVGFFHPSSTTLGANKAYLEWPKTANAPILRLVIDDEDNTTGIEQLLFGTEENTSVIYDLQGRRVQNPAKGLYIVNGKKILFQQ